MVIRKEDMHLPRDICIEILKRVSIRDILSCKCVCKSLRDLIKSDDFAGSYTPEPGVAFAHRDKGLYIVTDEAYRPLYRFVLPPRNHDSCHAVIDSTNGLIMMWEECGEILFICNPMTCEYVQLPPPPSLTSEYMYGFGVSKLSRKYKILCGTARSCDVYILGRGESGLWRRIAAEAPGIPIFPSDIAAFLNGNLHWLASKSEENFVCCFDLETKLFNRFSLPDRDYNGDYNHEYHLRTLESRLCLCDAVDSHLGVAIWWMNDYGDDNSWDKVYTIHRFEVSPSICGVVYPLRVFANGDLLFIAYAISLS
ncbi:putative F-box protein At3g16210 [Salvia splendens]|uniref:putative F-box protein At3g16210 n=1 Tax=Salvia splendens TaxID=180675 RepID=UPI001C252633|nr:putative F-box protein At3g16210 [Salvia splendens]